MATYRQNTIKIVEAIQRSDEEMLRGLLKQRVLVLPEEDDLQVLSDYLYKGSVKDFLILPPSAIRCSQKELAGRYRIDPAILCAVKKANREPTRDLVICALLHWDETPDLDTVQHILWELHCKPLHYETYSQKVNRRNFVLCNILQEKQASKERGEECPLKNWQTLADSILAYLELPILSSKKRDNDQDYRVPELPEEYRAKADEWQEDFDELKKQPVHFRRKEAADRYRQKKGLKNFSALKTDEEFRAKIHCSDKAIDNFFAKHSENSIGSRELAIEIAIALECTVSETNQILREIDQPLLCPVNSDEWKYIEQLRRENH